MAPSAKLGLSAGIRVLAVLLAAASLCWAALINGQPFFHPDSIGYVRGPDVAVMKLAGEKYATAWAKFDPGSVDQRHTATPPAVRTASYNDSEVLAGRSIYYGVLAYLGALTGGFWLTVFVQGLAVAWLVEILLRAVGARGLRSYAAVMAVIVLLTPAPFFVGFLMPDIWAGVGIAAAALLFAAPARLRGLDIAALGAMAIFAALAHNSVPLVMLALMAAGGGLWLTRRRAAPSPALGLFMTGLAVASAVAGNMAFSAMVRHSTGRPPVMPPFLSARLVADGAGVRFVRERCDGAFVVCRYGGRFPMSVDDFLWAEGTHGVFEGADAADRRALGDEQTRFALAVVRAYPLQQALASAHNVGAQLFATDLSDFNYKASVRNSLTARTPPATAAALRRTMAFAEDWPLDLFWAVQSALTLATLAITVGLIARMANRTTAWPGETNAATLFFALVGAGVIANGAVCGALSTLYGRYEARVIWTLPLAACALLLTAPPVRLVARNIASRRVRA